MSAATQLLNICTSPSARRRLDATGRISASGVTFIFPTKPSSRSLIVLASKSQGVEPNSNIKEPDPEEDDVSYLLKLGGGSVLAAAVIKYGSILFPEITRPNILQALFMISAPVIFSVFVLIKKSRVD